MPSIEFSRAEARLAYLALAYHLARPGSELDPDTKQPVEHGLSEVKAGLEPQIERAAAAITVNEHQYRRLVSAVAGALNELKSYHLLDHGRQTTVPAFHKALRALYPEIEQDPDGASQLAGDMMALRRRLERMALPEEPAVEAAASGGRPWWRFWER